MRSLQGLVKQAHIKELPLLDGTYDFAEVQLSFGRKVHIPLLDVSALLSSVESDSSEGNINLMVTVITAYITKLSNETILISVTDRTAKEGCKCMEITCRNEYDTIITGIETNGART